MADWFLGEIRLFPMNWAPKEWHTCDGSTMQIQSNAALYALLGTTYGGDGVKTFNLPDLRGRCLVHQNLMDRTGYYVRGKSAGVETVALTGPQIPPHQHTVNGTSAPSSFGNPNGSFFASTNSSPVVATAPNIFAAPQSSASMIPLNPATISTTPASAAHENMQPFLVLNFCIAIQGDFPPRN